MSLSNILLVAVIVAAHAIFLQRMYLMYRLVHLGKGTLGVTAIPRNSGDRGKL